MDVSFSLLKFLVRDILELGRKWFLCMFHTSDHPVRPVFRLQSRTVEFYHIGLQQELDQPLGYGSVLWPRPEFRLEFRKREHTIAGFHISVVDWAFPMVRWLEPPNVILLGDRHSVMATSKGGSQLEKVFPNSSGCDFPFALLVFSIRILEWEATNDGRTSY